MPAIWDDQARDTMRRAAKRAGIPTEENRFLLGLEPEVAALYTRNKLSGGGTETSGTRLLIVDAGGGTVDITAYEVEAGGRLAELIRADGDRLGSEYVNTAFRRRILELRLSSTDHSDGATRLAHYEEEMPGLLWELLQEFERKKITFNPDDNSDYHLSLPAQLYRELNRQEREALAARQNGIDYAFVFSRDEFVGLFDEILDPMLDLIEAQLEQVLIDAPGEVRLVLVGGFAQSRYFQRQLQRFESDRVTLVVPPNPASAVLYGAAHFSYDPSSLHIRRSRFTYGCDAGLPFEAIDPPELKKINGDGDEVCTNRFLVFVRIGEPVEVDSVVAHIYVPLQNKQKDISFTLYRTMEPDPRYVTDRGTVPIGNLAIKLPAALRQLPRKKREVELRMRFGGTEATATARIVATGEELETTVEFESRW